MTTVAVFDFDKTLTRRDTVVPFVRRVAGSRELAFGLIARSYRLAPAAIRRDRDEVRSIVTERVFRGRAVADVERHAQEHGARIAANGLRVDTTARLRWHLSEGHLVAIVSASYEHYVHVVGAQLGVDEVLATRLEVDGGRCTGRLLGANCRRLEKVRRLDDWLAGRGLERSGTTLWAYGDSGGDRELLAAADHPHLVKTPLASVAPTVHG